MWNCDDFYILSRSKLIQIIFKEINSKKIITNYDIINKKRKTKNNLSKIWGINKNKFILKTKRIIFKIWRTKNIFKLFFYWSRLIQWSNVLLKKWNSYRPISNEWKLKWHKYIYHNICFIFKGKFLNYNILVWFHVRNYFSNLPCDENIKTFNSSIFYLIYFFYGQRE